MPGCASRSAEAIGGLKEGRWPISIFRWAKMLKPALSKLKLRENFYLFNRPKKLKFRFTEAGSAYWHRASWQLASSTCIDSYFPDRSREERV